MNVTLIPFLLAANVAFEGTPNLEHGVRAVFTIVRSTEIKTGTFGSAVAAPAQAEISCQHVEVNKLRCIPTADDDYIVSAGLLSWGTFDITFDVNGVTNVTFSRTLPTNKIRQLKRIVNLFHVGTNLTSLNSSDDFVDGELTTMGMCLSHYYVLCVAEEDEDSKATTKQFTLDRSPIESETNCLKVSIKKSRQPLSCCAMGNYFFHIDPDFYVTSVKTFDHEIVIVPQTGTFMSTEDVVASAMLKKEVLTMRIRMKLKDIVPADKPFPEIIEPVTIDLKV